MSNSAAGRIKSLKDPNDPLGNQTPDIPVRSSTNCATSYTMRDQTAQFLKFKSASTTHTYHFVLKFSVPVMYGIIIVPLGLTTDHVSHPHKTTGRITVSCMLNNVRLSSL